MRARLNIKTLSNAKIKVEALLRLGQYLKKKMIRLRVLKFKLFRLKVVLNQVPIVSYSF